MQKTSIVAAIAFALLAILQQPSSAETPRDAMLQVINGSPQPVEVLWLRNDAERISNGTIPPGGQSFLSTTLGHRFVVIGQSDGTETRVTSEVPVQAVRFSPPDAAGIPAFYSQRREAGGFPIVASSRVSPFALEEAAFLVDQMLRQRPDVRQAMIASGSRLCILAHDEFTTDQPEFAHLAAQAAPGLPTLPPADYWDARARGMGGSELDPFCSCGEENLLGYPGDPYAAECILIHELAHNIHLRGMANVDPTFDERLRASYQRAMAAGLWKGVYASVNHHEYFAEGVQSWFDNNRTNNHDHNHVDTREELIAYDPGLAELCREVFGDTQLRYTKPATRLHGHLAGYDPATAPTFAWPDRLDAARQAIREQATKRNAEATAPPEESSAPPTASPAESAVSAIRKPIPDKLVVLTFDDSAKSHATSPQAFELLASHGILFAKRGGSPERPYETGEGFAFEPGRDHPLAERDE